MRRAILLILAALIPGCALGFWASYEVRLDEFRERPWLTVISAWTNDDVTSFTVVFNREDEYLHVDLRNENDVSLSYSPLRGEAIRRAMLHESALRFGLEPLWKKGSATVYRFAVNSHFLNKSRLSWQFVSPHDDLGNAATGGVLEWCYLSTLAQASQTANKNGAANGKQPFSSDTNRMPVAGGSRRSP